MNIVPIACDFIVLLSFMHAARRRIQNNRPSWHGADEGIVTGTSQGETECEPQFCLFEQMRRVGF